MKKLIDILLPIAIVISGILYCVVFAYGAYDPDVGTKLDTNYAALTDIQDTLSTSYTSLTGVDVKVDEILIDTGTTLPGLIDTNYTALTGIAATADDILVDTSTTLPAQITTSYSVLTGVDSIVDDILVDTATTIPGTITTLDGKVVTNWSLITGIDDKADDILTDTATTIPGTITTLDGRVVTNWTLITGIDSIVDDILFDTSTTIPSQLGMPTAGRAATATLYVSPNGDNSDGLTWATAYQTIQTALDAASTDADDLTLILISPHATQYDINATGDPTWAANVMLQGSHRTWAKVMNTHATATSIMKLTGKSGVTDVNFNLGTGTANGLIMTREGFRVNRCQFVGEDLTGAATALWLDGTATTHGKVEDCNFLGNPAYMTGILVDDVAHAEVLDSRIHNCLNGIKVVGSGSDKNEYKDLDIGECAIAINIDAGNDQHIQDVSFHHNTSNIDNGVGDHVYDSLIGDFPMILYPDNMTGVTLTANNVANVYGSDGVLWAAQSATTPFRFIALYVEPQIAQWYTIRLSADSGVTFFDRIMFNTSRSAGSLAPSGTSYIFNTGTRISASVKAESGGEDTVKVWIKLQTI